MMQGKLIVAVAGGLLAAGCGEAAEKAAGEAFDKSFTESCVASATSPGVPAEMATELCSCALDGINAKYSGTEKLTVPQEELQPILEQCIGEMGQG